ncbi:mechanosensitive ion channel family protein [Pontibacter sp. FD36]|uniref:mechanosensitive ion channel family protein n=1 Tax=Pontibacter sp. FD36 TaxID=2789860 RepID=UPI0018AB127C|nr:mechanosensitive ion channel family protein [Pontibacter sp. FD36]MBF8964478.1 mechanosensitive ion channel family protein [Pontibacter sp. FD36]
MDDIRAYLSYEFLGNTVAAYLWFATILLIGYIFKTLLSRLITGIIFRVVKRFADEEGQASLKRFLIQPLEMVVFLVFLFLAVNVLKFPSGVEYIGSPMLQIALFRIYQIFIIAAITWVITRFIDFFGLVFQRRASRTTSKLDDQLVPFFKDFSKVIIYIFAFLVVLGSVFGVNVAAIVASLGVGGLAIAFAAKESLENLLASFTIFLDHPFVVGDLVEVGGVTGVIEKIGFRSTRIRTLEKTFVTVPNKSMIDKPLNNLSLRTFRRVQFDVNLTYDTTSAQIKAITSELQEYIDSHPQTNQDGRIRFQNLGASSKDVMVLYFVEALDWNEYINIKEEVAYKIVEVVEKHGADFAFPTQTLHVYKENKRDTPQAPETVHFPPSDLH